MLGKPRCQPLGNCGGRGLTLGGRDGQGLYGEWCPLPICIRGSARWAVRGGLHLFAQDSLENLPRATFGELIHKVDNAGQFEFGQPGTAKGKQFLGSKGVIRL